MPFTDAKIEDPNTGDQRWEQVFGPYWEDWKFPVAAVQINPVTSKPDFSFSNISYDFDDSSTETVVSADQMSHTWQIGSTIRPHVHWGQTATGVVKWQLEYKAYNVGALEPAGWTTITTTAQDFTWASGVLSQASIFPFITTAGLFNSFQFKFKLSRLGSDGADTMIGDALFHTFDIHYLADTAGSRGEFTK